MNIRYKIIALLMTAFVISSASAQTNGCNSSYSRFGLGVMADQSQGFNKGMGGVALGLRDGQKVNYLNPASYAAIDSMSFIFDVGMTMAHGHMTQGAAAANANNASLSYVNAGFRLRKGLGMSFGFLPYSTIGFSFKHANNFSGTISSNTTYYGNGGLHMAYLGAGWNPFKDLSVGMNANLIWGDYNNSMAQVYYNGSTTASEYRSINQEVSSDIKTYKLDFAAQYPIKITKKDQLTIGATVSLGHKIGGKTTLTRYTSDKDTLSPIPTVKKAFSIPYTYGVGASWTRNKQLTVAADYHMERWAGRNLPVTSNISDSPLMISNDEYMNRHKVNVGAEYIPDPESRNYGRLIKYRLGAHFYTPNVKVNGNDGPTEFGITAGLGLPMTRLSKTNVNVAAEWMRRSASAAGMVKEDYFMLHLGVTVNERWFMKWKFN